ncbi:GNAT family N-acetyltransferase [Anderseniella sp. Alg231-50]|uniref:GNAT family N-acetyltransferase n=1 Tax=Anderseniella sp. Alg231-50 TaxID=1922226 RepID=UPI000D550242
MDPELQIVEGYRPGAVAAITAHHINYYAQEWGFGLAFETKVAIECAAFLQRYDERLDRVWLVVRDGAIEGSLILDHDKSGEMHDGLHLRWFIMSDRLRGTGSGRALMKRAVEFADEAAGGRVWLTTFRGLGAARRLYEDFGFHLASEVEGETWGRTVHEQLWLRHPHP